MDQAEHPLEWILRRCAAARPEPFHPSHAATELGLARERLDGYLDQLRLAGLLRLTDWAPGSGQGYTLTPDGERVLSTPRLLARLRQGEAPVIADGSPPAAAAPATHWERGEAARAALLHAAPARVTPILIALNGAVFAAGLGLALQQHIPLNQVVAGRSIEILNETGALRGADVYLGGQWWRMLTHAFVHVGFLHLAVNMYSLYIIGPLLEQLWGWWRFLILYLLAALGGACGVLIDDPYHTAAGASGAIWGIMASMATWLFLHRKVLPPALVASWFQKLSLIFLFNLAATLFIKQISKGAHFGGGLVGLVAAVPLDSLRFGTRGQRWASGLALVMIPVLCVGTAIRSFQRTGPEIKSREARWQNRHAAQAASAFANLRPLADAWAVLQTEAEPLLRQEPQARDQAKVRRVTARLRAERSEVEEAAEAFREHTPPYDPSMPWSAEAYAQLLAKGNGYVRWTLAAIDAARQRLANDEPLSPDEERLFGTDAPWRHSATGSP